MKSFIKRVKGFHLLFVYVKMKIIKWIINYVTRSNDVTLIKSVDGNF